MMAIPDAVAPEGRLALRQSPEPPLPEALLAIVRARTGVDFSVYRPDTIRRRIANRMLSLGIDTISAYCDLLLTRESEPLQLLERLTIKVSRFYRHAPAFDALRGGLLRELAAARGGAPVRIWSIGCGCGEEPYTLAMLLDEAGLSGVVHASDIDPAALERAAAAIYPQAALSELPAALAARYLEPVPCRPGQFRVRDVLRGRVQLSRQDVTSLPAPADDERFDLICCRNVLIYLQRHLHEPILESLRSRLSDGGLLCLGEAEGLPPTLATAFEALPRQTHIFRAVGESRLRCRSTT